MYKHEHGHEYCQAFSCKSLQRTCGKLSVCQHALWCYQHNVSSNIQGSLMTSKLGNISIVILGM